MFENVRISKIHFNEDRYFREITFATLTSRQSLKSLQIFTLGHLRPMSSKDMNIKRSCFQ